MPKFSIWSTTVTFNVLKVSQSRAIIDSFCQDYGFELTYYIETLFTGAWKQIRICQAHFTPESYDGQNLKKDAYPTLNVPCPLIPMCGKKGLQVGFLKFWMNETCPPNFHEYQCKLNEFLKAVTRKAHTLTE